MASSRQSRENKGATPQAEPPAEGARRRTGNDSSGGARSGNVPVTQSPEALGPSGLEATRPFADSPPAIPWRTLATTGFSQLLELGRGGFGEVRVGQLPDGRRVAIKRVPLHQSLESEKARQGMELVKDCQHPNLIHIEDFWTDDHYLWIVMELADESLLQRLEKHRQRSGEQGSGLPLAELLGFIDQAGRALDYLHGRDVLHRDVKPANLLLVGGQVRVADFDLARFQDPNRLATLAGTPQFMDPEVVLNRNVSPASDQYSLAMTYVELRTGRHPFADLPPMAVVAAIVRGEEVDLSHIPLRREREVLRKALSREAENRYPSCGAFVSELAEAVQSATRPARPRRWLRRLALAGGLLAIAAVVAFLLIRRPRFDWMPEGSVPHEDAKVILYEGRKLPSHVLLQRDGQEFHFLLIPPPDRESVAFYILRDKVSRRQFRVAWGTPEYQERLQGLQQRYPWIESAELVREPGDDDWPQFNLNILEAHVFALWLGGELPTDRQWLSAAGGLDSPSPSGGPFQLPAGWRAYDARNPQQPSLPPDWVAIDRGPPRVEPPQPLPVGKAQGDVSPHGVRDMSGNGKEWTGTDRFTRERLDFSNLKRDTRVWIRGADYIEPHPYQFASDPQSTRIERRGEGRGFRVVIPVRLPR